MKLNIIFSNVLKVLFIPFYGLTKYGLKRYFRSLTILQLNLNYWRVSIKRNNVFNEIMCIYKYKIKPSLTIVILTIYISG